MSSDISDMATYGQGSEEETYVNVTATFRTARSELEALTWMVAAFSDQRFQPGVLTSVTCHGFTLADDPAGME